MAIGTFLAVAIDASGSDLRALVPSALVHYRDALANDEPPIGVPLFVGEAAAHPAEVDVPVEPDLESMLRTEAAEQRVAVETLLGHAVLIYLADLDRGARISSAE